MKVDFISGVAISENNEVVINLIEVTDIIMQSVIKKLMSLVRKQVINNPKVI